MTSSKTLQDPEKLLPIRILQEMQKKFSVAITKMCDSPIKGGDPFTFLMIATKPHIVATRIHEMEVPIAGTDGETYYWNPDVLQKLTPGEIRIILIHETCHIYMFHCLSARAQGRNWYESIDFVVNGSIEAEHTRFQREFSLFGGNLGNPIRFKEYLDWIDGDDSKVPQKVRRCFSDPTVLNRSPESLHDEIQLHKKTSPRRCKTCSALSLDPATGKSRVQKPWAPGSCPDCGAMPKSGHGLDTHMSSKSTKQSVTQEMLRARSMMVGRGDMPRLAEEALRELEKPTLSAAELLRGVACEQKTMKGDKRDYKRPKRRPEYLYEKNADGVFVPIQRILTFEKKGFEPRFLGLIDTSASMTGDDMAHGMKEVKAFFTESNASGIVVPCDTEPKWEFATHVRNISDVQKVRIVGRGGTAFRKFFEEFPKKVGTRFDILFVITDGYFDPIPMKLRPPMEVIFIITHRQPVRIPFGRQVQLAPART